MYLSLSFQIFPNVASFRTQFSRLMGSISPRLMESRETGGPAERATIRRYDDAAMLRCRNRFALRLLHLVESPTFLGQRDQLRIQTLSAILAIKPRSKSIEKSHLNKSTSTQFHLLHHQSGEKNVHEPAACGSCGGQPGLYALPNTIGTETFSAQNAIDCSCAFVVAVCVCASFPLLRACSEV